MLALYAGLLHDNVVSTTLKNAPLSYQEWTQTPLVAWPAACFVPGVLADFDLPDWQQGPLNTTPMQPVPGRRLHAPTERTGVDAYNRTLRWTPTSHLAALGVEAGDVLFIHSSFKSLHLLLVADCARCAPSFGPDGLILMPSFHLIERSERARRWDWATTPSTVGWLTEFFRCLPDTYRSDHYSHSVAARGRGAADFVADHLRQEGHTSPWDLAPWGRTYGTHSPMFRAYRRGGKILMLGVDYQTSTYIHLVEVLYWHHLRRTDPQAIPPWTARVWGMGCYRSDDTRSRRRVSVPTFCHRCVRRYAAGRSRGKPRALFGLILTRRDQTRIRSMGRPKDTSRNSPVCAERVPGRHEVDDKGAALAIGLVWWGVVEGLTVVEERTACG